MSQAAPIAAPWPLATLASELAALAVAAVVGVLLVTWLLARRLERLGRRCPRCGDERCAGCE